MVRSTKYHIILLLVAIFIVILGGIYRSKLNDRIAEAKQHRDSFNESLLSEVESLKLAFQKSELKSIQDSLDEVSSNAMPSIVSIAYKDPTAVQSPVIYGDYLPDPSSLPKMPPILSRYSSGFLIDRKGYVLTSLNFETSNAAEFLVSSGEFRDKPAVLIGVDRPSGVALLRMNEPAFSTTVLRAVSEAPKVSDWLIDLGRSPSGEKIVVLGLLSMMFRDSSKRTVYLFGTETPGEQQGGPVVNLKGELVGMTVSKLAGSETRRVCIPVAYLNPIVERLKHQKVSEPVSWVGVALQEMNSNLQARFGVKGGVIVTTVVSGSPAEASGLQSGDVILRIGEDDAASAAQVFQQISRTPANSSMSLMVKRGAKQTKLNLKTAPYSERNKQSGAFGIQIDQTGVPLQDILPGGNVFQAGIRPGDRILEINGSKIETETQLRKMISQKSKGPQLWKIRRHSEAFYLLVGEEIGS